MASQLLELRALLVLLFLYGLAVGSNGRGHDLVNAPLEVRAYNLQESRVFECPANDGTYPSPGQCTNEYYVCENGVPTLQKCPGAYEIFDPVTFQCTFSDQASCNQKFTCTTDGIFPYPDSCTELYYICSGGQSFIEYCPQNFVFDPVTSKCTSIETASCSPGPSTSTTPVTTTRKPITLPTRTTRTKRPTTTTTTTTKKPRTTKSHTKKTTTTKSTTTTEHPDVFVCPSDYGLYPNPNDCTTFYSCSAGTPNLMTCPVGLYFNPTLLVCDWPSQVPSCDESEEVKFLWKKE